MSDHPVLVPTRDGTVGAIVTEPEAHRRAAAIILEGIGGRRYGVNGMWSRAAWALSDLGLVVLRMDYPGSGDSAGVRSGRGTEEVVLETVRWFRDRTSMLDLLLVGACYGASLAGRAAREESRLSRLILVTPHLRKIPSGTVVARGRRLMGRALRRRPRLGLDRRVCGSIAAAASKARTVAIAGELDGSLGDMIRLREMIARSGSELSIDLVPGTDLHGHRTLRAQRETVSRIVAEAARGLEEAGVSKVSREIRRFIERELLDDAPSAGDPLRDSALDSLDVEHLILFIEERFGVVFRDEEMTQEHFSSVDAVTQLVQSKLRLPIERQVGESSVSGEGVEAKLPGRGPGNLPDQ